MSSRNFARPNRSNSRTMCSEVRQLKPYPRKETVQKRLRAKNMGVIKGLVRRVAHPMERMRSAARSPEMMVPSIEALVVKSPHTIALSGSDQFAS